MSTKPITVDEICSINSTDAFKINQFRKKLGITQVFLAKCAGVPYANLNRILHQKESIPENYVEPLINALLGLYYVAQGRKVVPVKNGKRADKKTRYDEVVTFLTEVSEPVVDLYSALNSDRSTIMNDTLLAWSERADELLLALLENEPGE